eukprot:UN13351
MLRHSSPSENSYVDLNVLAFNAWSIKLQLNYLLHLEIHF